MTSKRDLERRLDSFENSTEYPDASLCELLSSETYEVVNSERSIVRLDYGTFHLSESLVEVLRAD